MRILLLVCLLLPLSLAWSQAAPGLPTTVPQESAAPADKDDDKQPMPDSASAVAPDAAVLTIKGLCAGNTPKPEASSVNATCQTVITRAQFERLTAAVQPNMPPTTKRQLASSYPRLLLMAHEAEQRGLDKQTHFQEMIAFARLQILSQDLVRNIQEAAAQVPAKDIEDYYHNNSHTFERASLERIMVPNTRQAEGLKDEGGVPSEARPEEKDKDTMRQEAEVLRARAAAGEDFTRLQKEAYDSAGLNIPPPSTSLVKIRRASLPSAHQSVFDLKPGEVSPVISDAGGYYIYKVVAKELEPLGEAEAEIHKALANQRMRAMLQKVEESVTTDVNQAYFGPATGQHRPPKPQERANPTGAAGATATTPNPK